MLTQIKIQGAQNFKTISQFLHHCSQTKNLRIVQEFYAHVIRAELFFISPNLQTDLVLTYTSCIGKNNHKILTHLLKSLNLRNPLPFNSIVSHFSQHGSDCYALHTFSFMHRNSVYVDSYALCTSLKSASCLKKDVFGKLMHAYVEKSGWFASVFVGSALVDFYAKLWSMSDAAMVFDEIPEKNTVCANALLSGYAEAKMWGEGIELVRRMHLLRLETDNFTLSAALRACSGLCAVELGKEAHASVVRRIIDVGADVFLQSLLIEMYGKCGLVNSAKKVFSMAGYVVGKRRRDVVLWTSMLGVYGRTGDYSEVIRLFRDMLMEGIRPDGVAFLTVISACSHTGQVDLGMEYFESMTRDYGLNASREHYSCLVDLLCRAGELERAWRIVSELPHTADCTISMWGTLLSACNECGNVSLGKLAAQKAFELEPTNVGIYVLLSNMYARNGMWDEIEQLRELMKRRGLKKDIAWSSIDR
uniref:Pentatricopeptide repeat protein n=1 Tax=Salvia miltiorrhiza TaxID=226208 RepID=A0A678WDZ7_SALMI|nr:pentatricopeptide repeat protein [Salvia miltiorrhiza]